MRDNHIPQPDSVSQIDGVAILQERQMRDALAVNECSVGTARILDSEPVSSSGDANVPARDFRIDEHQVITGTSPDGKLFAFQRHLQGWNWPAFYNE